MSSKIQELAAVIGREEGFGPEVWQTTFTDKFAEAIIEQCLSIIDDESMKVSQHWTCKNGKHIYHQIADHFGD